MTFPIPNKHPFDFDVTRYPHLDVEDPENTISIDWETEYDNEYSLRKMSSIAYVMDKRFHPYLVSIKGKVQGQEIRYSGRPGKFPWTALIEAHKQKQIRLLAHNAGFDEIVTWRYLSTEGIDTLEWLTNEFLFLCTADMAGYLKYPRPLAGLSYSLKLKVPDKSIRDRMKGVDFTKDEELTPERLNYALGDSENCLDAWFLLQDQWPEPERIFAMRNRRRGYRGVPMNVNMLEAGIQRMEEVKVESETGIPWKWKEKGNKTPLSPIAMAKQCEIDGIPVPASFAEAKAEEWENKHMQDVPWMIPVRDWRKANTHGSRMTRMKGSVQSFELSQMMHFQQMYCGAHTGRSSGSGGINMQNMPKEEIVGGVNIRHMIEAPPGYDILIADYSQIEPRLLYHRCGMQHILDMAMEGMNIYDAHARSTMGYTKIESLKEYPKLYSLAKFRCIGLGYGCGWRKGQVMCETYGFSMNDAQAQKTVNDYRDSHQAVVSYWYDHDGWLQKSARDQDADYSYDLMSGRTFSVYNPRYVKDTETGHIGVKAQKVRGGSMVNMWGGHMTENEMQGTGMDIMKYAITQMPPELVNHWVLDSHDEIVLCVPKKKTVEYSKELVRIMCDIPWLPKNFPLEADVDVRDRYMKT